MRAVLLTLALGALAAGCCFCPLGPSGSGSPQSEPPDPSLPQATLPTAPPPLPPGVDGHTRIARIDVWLPATKPTGAAWDIGGGAPDPFVTVRQGGITLVTTDRMQDSLSASWALDVPIDPAQPLTLDVWDRDLSEHDAVGSIPIVPLEGTIDGDIDEWNGGTYRVEIVHR